MKRKPGSRAARRTGIAIPLVVLGVLVLYGAVLGAALRREDVSAQSDRAEARLVLVNHLASAADECWWQLTSGAVPPKSRKRPGRTFFDVFADARPDPAGWSQSMEPELSRAGIGPGDGTTLSAVTFDVPAWQATGKLPQGLVRVVVPGSSRVKRGHVSLALHQLRRFWVYALPDGSGTPSFVTGPMFTREVIAQWVEEVP